MIEIIAFGQIATITGNRFQLPQVGDTQALTQELYKLYPALQQKKFALAVNKQLVNEPALLPINATVALLPPFSGG